MPIKENIQMEEFPYAGEFYVEEMDNSLPLDEREVREIVVLETSCDIQRRGKAGSNGLIAADYAVFFPLEENPDSECPTDKYGPIPVRRGMKFRGWAYGYTAEGVVEFVRPSQLGRCSVDVKIVTETEV